MSDSFRRARRFYLVFGASIAVGIALEIFGAKPIRMLFYSAIVNGVVFALSSGEFRSSDALATAKRSSKAVLYALDSATGKELWNSGDAITSFVHSGGLAAGGGRVYVGGHDGTQYAFGFPMEH